MDLSEYLLLGNNVLHYDTEYGAVLLSVCLCWERVFFVVLVVFVIISSSVLCF